MSDAGALSEAGTLSEAGAMSEAGLADALLEAMTEAVVVVDRNRRITYWSAAAERLTGFTAAEVIGRPRRDGILNHVDEAGRSHSRSRCELSAVMRSGQPRAERVYLHHRDGHKVPVRISAVPLRGPDGRIRGAVEVFYDDQQHRAISDDLDTSQVEALTDPLTRLANQRMLTRTLQRHRSEYRRDGRTFAVVMADIDDFAAVNDSFGRDAADQICQLVARTLASCVRPSDTPGRWQDEKFMVVAPVGGPDEALALARRIRTLTSGGSVDLGTEKVSVTVSVGVTFVRRADTWSAPVKRADRAMQAARSAGGNRVVLL